MHANVDHGMKKILSRAIRVGNKYKVKTHLFRAGQACVCKYLFCQLAYVIIISQTDTIGVH